MDVTLVLTERESAIVASALAGYIESFRRVMRDADESAFVTSSEPYKVATAVLERLADAE